MGKASARKKRLRKEVTTHSEITSTDEALRARAQWANAVKAQSHTLTAEAWRAAQNLETVQSIISGLQEAADENIDRTHAHLAQLRQAGMADMKTDCAKGCSVCCSVEASAAAPEVLYVAAHLKATRSAEELNKLRAELGERNALSRTISDAEKVALKRRCPLLGDDGACTVYPVRPMTCRTHYSKDVNQCNRQRAGERVPIPTIPEFAYATQPLLTGALAALEESGCNVDPLWLPEALEIALEDGTAEAWCRGEDPFRPASKLAWEKALMKRYRDEGIL